jgi:hypothetical protein
MKLDAVLDHACLYRRRRLYAVASGLGGCRLQSYHADAGVCALPKVAAVLTNVRILLHKISKRDLVIV